MAGDREMLRKAAVVLRSLPADQRTCMLAKLDPPQATAVLAEMNSLESLRDGEQETVTREFITANPRRQKQHSEPQTAPFAFLRHFTTNDLLDLIADEQPGAVALLLSCLPAKKASDVLAELPPDRQLSVIRRIASLSETSRAVIRDVENAVRQRLFEAVERTADNRGVGNAVRILNAMEPPIERRLLHQLAEIDPGLFQDIRRGMFGDDVAMYADTAPAKAAV